MIVLWAKLESRVIIKNNLNLNECKLKKNKKPTPAVPTTTAAMTLQSSLLIKGGRVVNHDRAFMADVLVEDGIIKFVENIICSALIIEEIFLRNELNTVLL